MKAKKPALRREAITQKRAGKAEKDPPAETVRSTAQKGASAPCGKVIHRLSHASTVAGYRLAVAATARLRARARFEFGVRNVRARNHRAGSTAWRACRSDR